MGLHVKERVHIMPVGYEHDRIVDAAKEFRADRVCLLSHSGNESIGHWYLADAERALNDANIEVEIDFCDIFDFYDSLGTIGEWIKKYNEDDVYVNIATGSKVTAVAGFIAATILEKPAYYGKAEQYDDGIPSGIGDIFELPNYPIDAPDEEQMLIVAALHDIEERTDGALTKGQLIHIAEHNNLEFTRRDVDEKGLYRLLDKEILHPLEQREYVRVFKKGRNKCVELTDTGKDAYRAFRALIPEYDINYGTLLE